jgi:hypothetical protein
MSVLGVSVVSILGLSFESLSHFFGCVNVVMICYVNVTGFSCVNVRVFSYVRVRGFYCVNFTGFSFASVPVSVVFALRVSGL